jgi:hypothetical protein
MSVLTVSANSLVAKNRRKERLACAAGLRMRVDVGVDGAWILGRRDPHRC